MAGEAEQCEFTVNRSNLMKAFVLTSNSLVVSSSCCFVFTKPWMSLWKEPVWLVMGEVHRKILFFFCFFTILWEDDKRRYERENAQEDSDLKYHTWCRNDKHWIPHLKSSNSGEDGSSELTLKNQAAVNSLLPIGCYDVWPQSIFQITLESKRAWYYWCKN